LRRQGVTDHHSRIKAALIAAKLAGTVAPRPAARMDRARRDL
jgi:hypothetical protein